jgi:hypothetical protein
LALGIGCLSIAVRNCEVYNFVERLARVAADEHAILNGYRANAA